MDSLFFRIHWLKSKVLCIQPVCDKHKCAHNSLRKWCIQKNRNFSIFYANAPVTHSNTQQIYVCRTQAFAQSWCKADATIASRQHIVQWGNPAVVAWRYSSGLITELSLSRWINPRLGHAYCMVPMDPLCCVRSECVFYGTSNIGLGMVYV